MNTLNQKIKSLCLLIVMLFGVAMSATANTWYVAKNGEDTASGAKEAPFASIEKALEFAVSGDEIIVCEGEYTLASTNGVFIPSGVTVTGDSDAPEKVVFTPPQFDNLDEGCARLFIVSNAVVRGVSLIGGYTTLSSRTYGEHNVFQPLALKMSNDAVVSNCVISDCRGPIYASVVDMSKNSLLANCIVRNTRLSNHDVNDSRSFPVYASASTIADCIITNNESREYATVSLLGGSHLLRSVISDNERLPSYYGGPIALNVEDSTVEDCVVSDNVHNGFDAEFLDSSCAVRSWYSNFRRVVIARNRTVYGVAGVYTGYRMMLENCLIADNYSAQGFGGGIYNTSEDGAVDILHCTIVGNQCDALLSGGHGLKSTSNQPLNINGSIIWGNGDGDVNVVADETTVVSSLVPDASAFDAAKCTNLLTGEPGFVNFEKKDYALSLGSQCIDAATGFDAAGCDIAGTVRPQGDAADIGCYEFVPSLYNCKVIVGNEVTAREDVTLGALAESSVEGAAVSKYEWSVLRGDVVVASQETTEPEWNYSFDPGDFEVVLTVRWQDGGSAVASWNLSALPSVTYVSLTGRDEWPYDEAAKAARNIQAALDACARGGEVRLAAGTYGVACGQDAVAEYLLNIERAVSLVGLGANARETVIDCEDARMGVRLANGGASITNLTIARSASSGSATTRGYALSVHGGTVDDCVVTGGKAKAGTNGESGVFLIDGAVMRGSVIENCVRGDDAWTAQGPTLLALKSAFIDRVVVTNNNWHGSGHGGTVTLNGGDVVMRDSLVENNWMQYSYNNDYATAGVSVANGAKLYSTKIIRNTFYSAAAQCSGAGLVVESGDCVVEGCMIVSNKVVDLGYEYITSVAGVASKRGAVIRNSIIAFNSCNLANNSMRTSAGGVIMSEDGADLRNCTIVGNTCVETNNCGVYISGGAITNCIVYGNGSITNDAGTVSLMSGYGLGGEGYLAGDLNFVGGEIGYSCFPVVVAGKGNTAGDPKFMDPASGNFRLKSSSSARNKGDSTGYSRIDDLDLDGNRRWVGKSVDMGSYECQQADGFFIILK